MSAEMQVNVETLCSMPPGCGVDAVTADGHSFAFCQDSTEQFQFMWDGVAGEPFDVVDMLRDETAAIYPSDDGAHVAYVGLRGEQQFVGRDGIEDQPFEAISHSVPPTFVGGGRHLAYGAHVPGGDFRLVLDGVPVGSGSLAPMAVVFSPDGQRLAYLEMRGESRRAAECRIVLDGRPGDWFAGTRNAPGMMQFSPDGSRFAYCAIDGEGPLRWFVDGVPQRLVNEVPTLSVAGFQGIGVLESPVGARFSPDGKRFAYFADVVEKGVAIVEDDVPGPLFKAVGFPVFSPDSRRLAYMAHTYDKKIVLVVEGAVASEWEATGSGHPVFSSDSNRVAVTLQREAGWLFRKRKLFTAAVDGRTYSDQPGDDASEWPTFSPDGGRVAWWLRRGADMFVVIDGIVQPRPSDSVLRFDPAGRIVYVGRVGTSQTIVVDDRAGPLADAVVPLVTATEAFTHAPWMIEAPVPFRISAESGHVAWAGVFGDQVRPVLDDEVGPPFDEILACDFAEQGTAVWWAQRGQERVRVTTASARD
jgi:hypothetical protein